MAHRELKNQARTLYLRGLTAIEISEQVDIPLRTVQRWIRDFREESVTVEVEVSEEKVESEDVISSQIEDESISLEISSQTAIRLLSLGQTAIATVERILEDENTSDRVKLQAAALAGKWTGLEERKLRPMLETVAMKSGVSPHLESSTSRELKLKPTVVVKKEERERLQRSREEASKQKEEIKYQQEQERNRLKKVADDMRVAATMFQLANDNFNNPNYAPLLNYADNFDAELFLDFLETSIKNKKKILETLLKLKFVEEIEFVNILEELELSEE